MKSPDPLVLSRLLRDALTVLAADVAAQMAWLDEHDVPPDEIALHFDDAFQLLNGLSEEQGINEGIVNQLRQIDVLLAGMSGQNQSERWTKPALDTDDGWSRVRLLARGVLVELTGSWEHPLPSIQVIR